MSSRNSAALIGSALIACALLALPSTLFASPEDTRLLRQPTISENHIAFVHALDIWIADRDGGEARRLTSFDGVEGNPAFSPDGKHVAFTGQYDGNTDVYVVPIEGGSPQRLTWHPGFDGARGWTPDGERVVIASVRKSAPSGIPNYWTVGLDGRLPEEMPIPQISDGMLSPDGKHMAFQKNFQWDGEWRNYRGGQNNPIRILNLKTLEEKALPWTDSKDLDPVWIGDEIFFLSDRDWAMNVWSYDAKSGELTQRTHYKTFDCKGLTAGGGLLAFENEGALWTLSPDAGAEPKRLQLNVRGDFSYARPHWEDVSEDIRWGNVSPTGKRAIFEARGEIFTVPKEHGDVRNLSQNSGAADRAPAWSPDGKHVSWFSDAHDELGKSEYALVIADQFGKNQRRIELENPTFYYTPSWSPDSKWISYGDADRNLWVLNVKSGETQLIDNEGFAHPERLIEPSWSPDSKHIAYTRRLESQYNAVFIYTLADKTSRQVTDGMSESRSPSFDQSGKYLYFLASVDYSLRVGWLDMTSYDRPFNHSIYAAVLAADEPSPLAPRSDDEEVAEEDDEAADESDKDEKKKSKKGDQKDAEESGDEKEDDKDVRIDWEGLQHRIVALDVPARPYVSLAAGEEGAVFYAESVPNEPGFTLHRYKLKDRKADVFASGVRGFTLSTDGSKVLWSQGGKWGVSDSGGKADPGKDALPVNLKMKVDPKQEWRQLFREAWRYQRDFFYVDNVHGLDLDWAWKAYSPWLDHIRHRSDLNHLLDVLGGETVVGHSFVGGGDTPNVETVPTGLLGADFQSDGGNYKITRIYTGESWNPDLQAPLSGPGIDVKEGEYLLAVDGVRLDDSMNLYAHFERKAGVATTIIVGPNPSLEGSREIETTPVGSEEGLRRFAWIEDNRRKVDELSGGKLAYVWLPNTGGGGYSYFNRYYFAQQHKKGAVIDERWNGGGSIADYIIDLLAREKVGYFNNPVGDRQPFLAPNAALYGPKAMIINEGAGSGGDMMPYMFRQRGIGPLVGTKTWGGLVGIWDVPLLIDGGRITAPRGGFYDLDGNWAVENEGIAPDVHVEQDVKSVMAGGDPQLEAAVREVLKMLETQEEKHLPQPPDPIRVKRPE